MNKDILYFDEHILRQQTCRAFLLPEGWEPDAP